tara:strand:+ start:203 stop:409 length:207 start_codon:yes stop_codon:yes gene_type:complete
MSNSTPDENLNEELTNEEIGQIAGGNFSIKDLADRLKVPEGKRNNFYKKLMSPKSFSRGIDSPVHPYD